MKKFSILLIAALAIVACTKKFQDIPQPQKLIHKTFTVSAPVNPDGIDTASKTELASDGLTVNWSVGDEINVIGITADGTATQHPFSIKSGAGTPSAIFEGEVGENEETFYAIYPNIDFDPAKFAPTESTKTPHLCIKNTLPDRAAIKGGFDKNTAIMMAKADDSGNFAFLHGMAYIKIKVGVDYVQSIKIQTSGSARFNGKPSLDLGTLAFDNVEGAKNEVTMAGEIEKDGIYYIPVTVKASDLKTITITYEFSDGSPSQSISTTKMNSKQMELGKIYDFGCPPIVADTTPSIDASNVSLEAEATSGAIAYSIVNPVDGGVVTAALKETSDWLTVGSVSNGSVALSCSANTGAARSAVVTLTYTYGDSQTVTTDVTVSQKGASAQDLVTLTWDFTSDQASGTPAVGKTYKYENGAFSTVVTEITETETLYLVNGKGAKFASKSMTVAPKTKYYYLSYGGNADYLVFKTAMKGTLSVYATMNVESGNYDCVMGVKVNGSALSNTFNVGFLNTTEEMLGATAGTWTIDNTSGDAQEIQIVKTSGSKSPWVYKIVFEQSE